MQTESSWKLNKMIYFKLLTSMFLGTTFNGEFLKFTLHFYIVSYELMKLFIHLSMKHSSRLLVLQVVFYLPASNQFL